MKDKFGLSPEKQKQLIELKHENTKYAKIMGFKNSNQRFAKITTSPQHFKNKDGIYEDIDINFTEDDKNFLCMKRNINIGFSKSKKLNKFISLRLDDYNRFDLSLDNLEINSEKISINKFKRIKNDNKKEKELKADTIYELTDDVLIKNIITDNTFQLMVNDKKLVNKFKIEFKINLKGLKCINRKNSDETEYLLNKKNGFTFVGSNNEAGFTIHTPVAYSNDMKKLFNLNHKLLINNNNELTYIKYFDKLPEFVEDATNIWIDLYIIDDIHSINDLISAINTQSDRQKYLKEQISLNSPKPQLQSELIKNAHQLRIMYAALGLLRNEPFSYIENRYPDTNHPLNNYINEINNIVSLINSDYIIEVDAEISGYSKEYDYGFRYVDVVRSQKNYLVKYNSKTDQDWVYNNVRHQYRWFNNYAACSDCYDSEGVHWINQYYYQNNEINAPSFTYDGGNNIPYISSKYTSDGIDDWSIGVEYTKRGEDYNGNDIYGYELKRLHLAFDTSFLNNLNNSDIHYAKIQLYGYDHQRISPHTLCTDQGFLLLTGDPYNLTNSYDVDNLLCNVSYSDWPNDYSWGNISKSPGLSENQMSYINFVLSDTNSNNYIKNIRDNNFGMTRFIVRDNKFDVCNENIAHPNDSYVDERFAKYYIANSNDGNNEHRPTLYINYTYETTNDTDNDLHFVSIDDSDVLGDPNGILSGTRPFSFVSKNNWEIRNPRHSGYDDDLNPPTGNTSYDPYDYRLYDTNSWLQPLSSNVSGAGSSNVISNTLHYSELDTNGWYWGDTPNDEYKWDHIEIYQPSTGKSISKNIKRWSRFGFRNTSFINVPWATYTKNIYWDGRSNEQEIEYRGNQLPTLEFVEWNILFGLRTISKPSWVNSVSLNISNWSTSIIDGNYSYSKSLKVTANVQNNNSITNKRSFLCKITDCYGNYKIVKFIQRVKPVLTISPITTREFDVNGNSINGNEIIITSNERWYSYVDTDIDDRFFTILPCYEPAGNCAYNKVNWYDGSISIYLYSNDIFVEYVSKIDTIKFKTYDDVTAAEIQVKLNGTGIDPGDPIS